MREFKIRCSKIGVIMTGTIGLTDIQQNELNQLCLKKDHTEKQKQRIEELTCKSNNKELPKTAKSYCEEWLKEQLYCRKKEFSNKYTQKGLIVEDNSIDFISEQLGLGLLFKNEKYFENEYMHGTPDIVLKHTIIDAKNSWDPFTFPLFEKSVNSDYFWQAQGYMELTGVKKYILAYVLSDTPENIIEREVRSYCYQNGIEEIDSELYDQFHANMTYEDVDNALKIKTFEISYSQKCIEEIKERVEMCRDYIKSLQ